MKKKTNKAFTLVELIVVITILAILGTIAFISLQGYSKTARDSRRISDISNIKTSLELFILNTGYYPQPDVIGSGAVYYSGDLLWTQGTVGNNVATNLSRNLQNKPLDPLFDIEYTYSLASSNKEYQLMTVYEGELSKTNNLLNNSYASNSDYKIKVEGIYNEIFLKTLSYIVPVPSLITSEDLPFDLETDTTKIESMVITNGTNFPKNTNIPNTIQSTGGLDGLILSVYTGSSITKDSSDTDKIALIDAIQVAYNGTTLANESIYKNILDKTSDTDKLELINYIVLNKSEVNTNSNTTTYSCTGTVPTSNVATSNNTGLTVDTAWQNTASGDDCYYECTGGFTGTNCDVKSPLITSTDCTNANWIRVDDTTDTIGNGFCISPRVTGGTEYISWQDVGTAYGWRSSTLNVMTAANAYADNQYGVTYDLGLYTCKSLGTSVGGLTLSDGNNTVLSDNPDSILSSDDTIENRMRYLAKYKTDNIKLDNIDWISVPNKPATFSNPALYLSDCIDGTRDLTTGKTYDEVDYATYSDAITNTDASRILRNRYLLGWTKTTGSHLPSAFSDISSEKTDMLTTNKGEYQIACDAGKFGAVSGTAGNLIGSEDDIANMRIWLSAVGGTNGTDWGCSARVVGNNGCGYQNSTGAGNRSTLRSARFVVRP